jgi:hypothetical protein
MGYMKTKLGSESLVRVAAKNGGGECVGLGFLAKAEERLRLDKARAGDLSGVDVRIEDQNCRQEGREAVDISRLLF